MYELNTALFKMFNIFENTIYHVSLALSNKVKIAVFDYKIY